MRNYERHKGDDLLSKDRRLKYKWRWCRNAAQFSKEETKKWTHFQTSHCRISNWILEAVQWGSEPVYYEAIITYNGDPIASVGHGEEIGFKTRIGAQIGAEELLEAWIKEEHSKIVSSEGKV